MAEQDTALKKSVCGIDNERREGREGLGTQVELESRKAERMEAF